ncbi:hypothetical protein [Argonema galeatum]|uniref:hypothetical protein n=1 Tax=Argonema galeatum TaxID=2942762 RepID=UPI002012627E|nr:hypothetical protein [Argonema galeatum]MCL1469031.1 hypothetical protein [Argonema galeatum A003/A1]
MTHPTFLQELQTVLEILARLSESPEWKKAYKMATDDREMTLEDAFAAVDWLVHKTITTNIDWSKTTVTDHEQA